MNASRGPAADGTPDIFTVIDKAADKIESLMAERDALHATLFLPIESDASLNLEGVLHDLQGAHDPNDGGVCARTVSRVIDQLEKARATLSNTKGEDHG